MRYVTRRQLLEAEYTALESAYKSALAAYGDLVDGKITSYNLGHYSVTRNPLDLEKLQHWMDDARVRMNEILNMLSGKPRRWNTTYVYANPMNVLRKF